MGIYVILSFLKKSKLRFGPDINMQKLIILMLGKYNEFGKYLYSDTTKKILESFFERILCLKMPVHASDINFIRQMPTELVFFYITKTKIVF